MAAGFVCVFLLLLGGTGGVSPVSGLQNRSRQRARAVPASFLAMPGKWP